MDAALYTGEPRDTPRSERAYTQLKTRLLLGEFPLNARLGEERLAGLLGMSRTPVREALQRLHAEGLLDRFSEGGFCPSAPDIAGIHELYEVRLTLELQALSRPDQMGGRHDPAVLEPLRDDWRALDLDRPPADPGFVMTDERFHVRLAESAGNQAIADLLTIVNERIRTVRMHDFLTDERVERTISQHLGIVEAVLALDVALALTRFRAHLGESMAVVEDRATRAVARMASGKAAVQA